MRGITFHDIFKAVRAAVCNRMVMFRGFFLTQKRTQTQLKGIKDEFIITMQVVGGVEDGGGAGRRTKEVMTTTEQAEHPGNEWR